MKNKIKVSILMPSYNVVSFIRECLESVISQTLKEIEIICIDAGSTDGTLDVLNEYVLVDERIRLFRSDIKSYGHQMNIGIKAAKGEYIGIVETDDFVEPNMFEMLYKKAIKLKADVVKGPYYEYMSNSKKAICYYSEFLNNKLPIEKCFSIKEYGDLLVYHASVWTGIYKTSYLLSNNIFFIESPGAGYVDVGFRIDSLINSSKIAWDKTAYYNYRVSNSSSSTNQFKLSTMIDRWHEVHNKFENNPDDYIDYYGSYLLKDEYLNTLAYIGLIDINNEDLQKLIYNYSQINNELLNKSNLNRNIVRNIMAFKKNPIQFYKSKHRYKWIYFLIRNIFNSLFPKGTKIRAIIKRTVL